MKLKTAPSISGLLVLRVLVTGCAGGGGAEQSAEESASSAAVGTNPAQSPTAREASSGATASGSSTGTAPGSTGPQSSGGQSSGGAVDELRAGTWQVGEAGEVEFALDNGALSLTEVRPSEGWQQRVADEKPDEIEVHFTQDTTDWKFEVELDDADLEISKELEIKQAEGGTYQVGDAGEVSFTVDDSTVTLVNVRTNNGWTVTKQDDSTDDIEIDFTNTGTGASAEFEAEIDDGAVELEIDQKLTGPIPN